MVLVVKTFNKLDTLTPENLLTISTKSPRTSSKRHFKFYRKHKFLKLNNFLKSKVKFYKKKLGRTLNGQLVSFYKTSGYRRLYRQIDNIRYPLINFGIIEQLEFNPIHSCLLARIYNPYLNYHFYIRAIEGLKIGKRLSTGKEVINLGDSAPISNILIGQPIHNINIKNSNNVARSAGTYAVILQKYYNYSLIRFPSQKLYYVPSNSQATLGRLCNSKHKLINLGKAGRNIWFGNRPHTRGVAMNPIDHPHGGGKGKTSGGHSTSVSPWGKPTKQIKKKKMSYCAKNRKKVTVKRELE
jgi:large subunit ribosomal protein L2